jgi:hypothetical protein
MNAMGKADIICAGRDKALIHPVMTKVALLRDGFVFVECDRIIRACSDAGLTSCTQIVFHDDNAVRPFDDRFFRTGLGTGGGVAVPAQVDLEYELRSIVDPPWAVFPHRNQFDPGSGAVFLLAGRLAGSAAPTEGIIYS